jgi:transposase
MRFFEEQWHAEQQHHAKMLEMQRMEHEKAWDSAQIAYQADQWAQEHEFNQIYENADKETTVDPETEQQVIKGSATQMMEVMMKDPEERFQNSKFLQFLSKLNNGEYKIVGNELISDPEQVKADEQGKNLFFL